MQEKWKLPEDRPKRSNPSGTDISQQLEAVGSHFGQLGEDVDKWGESFGTLEQRRRELEEAYTYMQSQAKSLGGGAAQTGAPPNTALIVQAATQVAGALIQSLWIRAFGSELDAIMMAQIAILIQFVIALAVSTYLNKVAGR